MATNTLMRHGWDPRAVRAADVAPAGHRCGAAFVAGLRKTGIVAPLVIDGAMDEAMFPVRLELSPAPTPTDIVVMDNLPVHKVAGARRSSRRRARKCCICPPALRT